MLYVYLYSYILWIQVSSFNRALRLKNFEASWDEKSQGLAFLPSIWKWHLKAKKKKNRDCSYYESSFDSSRIHGFSLFIVLCSKIHLLCYLLWLVITIAGNTSYTIINNFNNCCFLFANQPDNQLIIMEQAFNISNKYTIINE